jgi:hypothetical protein
MLQGAEAMIQGWHSAVSRQPERIVLPGGILLASALSGATPFVLVQYYSMDVLSSLVFKAGDCTATSNLGVGKHCANYRRTPHALGRCRITIGRVRRSRGGRGSYIGISVENES